MNPFSALTSKIFAGVSAALLIAALLMAWHISNLNGDVEDARNALATEHANHAVTRASVATCERAIEDQNADIIARAKTYDDLKRQSVDERKKADSAYRSTQSRIDGLLSKVGTLNNGKCETPDVGEL